ncbi:uncharacterized protein PAC_11092 [Phialocephala subalpina]|uniref:Uncharacterized protein n=1 Tax=Phialocephala subalpina TaxID=576137 RepID=A0A1L7X858_9HELO|nr:uncharacterized protein PAC_11092 [Phialocephala subalpina]
MSNTTASPEARVGWVSSGDGRSTSDILWSCFSVILVCAWSCLHLNVPSVEESEAGWLKWHGMPYWPQRPLLNKWSRKVFWMITIVIAPEIGVAYATKDYLTATISIAEANIFDSKDAKVGAEKDIGIPNHTVRDEREKLTKSHAFLANMGGFKIRLCHRVFAPSGSDSPATDTMYEGVVLNYKALEHLHDNSTDFEIPTEEDIKGVSKGDAFTKAFACIQSAWLVVQCMARAATGLPITQLELATIVFVICGTLMYLLWWNKPFGTERRELVVATTDKAFDASTLHIHKENYILRLAHASDANAQADLERIRIKRIENPKALSFLATKDIKASDLITIAHIMYGAMRNLLGCSTTPIYPSAQGGASIAFHLSGALFSAFHILAWNWDFPSSSIRIAWRVFSLISTCANPVLIAFTSLSKLLSRRLGNDLVIILPLSILLIYFLARLGLIVLIFHCFSSMPSAIYQAVYWTKFLPHFS